MLIFIVTLLTSIQAYAFLDFIGDQAKKAVEVAAYIDAAAELSNEIAPDKDIEEAAQDIKRRTESVRNEASTAKSISNSTQALIKGPDWSSKRLETNIRSTTDYIRRLKSLLVRAAVLGNEGTIALNTTETNVALNEVQKNQQTLILQNTNRDLREIEKEQEEFKQWKLFSSTQRKIRNSESQNGKL